MTDECTKIEKGYTHRLVCSQKTFNMIMKDCIQEFIRNNPDVEGLNITQNYILRRIAKYYLGIK